MYTHCPAQSRWKQENLNSLRVQELINLPEYQQILKEVSEAIGKPITFLDLGTLSDTLEFLKHSGKEVPPFFVDEKSELLRGLKAIYNLYIQCVLAVPTYASVLAFELYEKGGRHTFKVNYNGEHRPIPFCGNEYECPVERLYEWYDSWRVEDVIAGCDVPVDKPVNITNWIFGGDVYNLLRILSPEEGHPKLISLLECGLEVKAGLFYEYLGSLGVVPPDGLAGVAGIFDFCLLFNGKVEVVNIFGAFPFCVFVEGGSDAPLESWGGAGDCTGGEASKWALYDFLAWSCRI
ncbi:unnamed protein product [Sphagnum balticum]